MIDHPSQPVVYVDANAFIYAVEGTDSLARPINELFQALKKRPHAAVTSELTLAEVLPKAPSPQHRRTYLDLMVWSGIFDLRPITRDILIETADYRKISTVTLPDGRETMPKLPDAIHVVTAIRSGCKRLLSADSRMKLPAELTLIEATSIGIAALISELS